MSAVSRLLLVAALALAGCATAPLKDPSLLPLYAGAVTTDDGWELSLFRVRPDGGVAGGAPVLLVHGMGVGSHFFLHEDGDLAGYLAGLGFDVWIASYRGDRASQPPSMDAWKAAEWSADTLAQRDLPAILRHVEQQTNRGQVWLVGHSLGGALGYTLLQGPDAGRIAGLVALAAPAGLPHPNRALRRVADNPGLLGRSGRVPTRNLGRLAVPLLDMASDAELLHVAINTTNADPRSLIRFVGPGFEDSGRGVAEQAAQWIETGRFLGADGRDLGAGLAGVTAPVLVAAGRVDHLVPPWAARQGFDQLGSPDKSWVVFGRGWGTVDDYGHGDLLLGSRARQEVFPVIGRWLVARAVGASAVQAAFPEAVDRSLDDLTDSASPAP